MQITISAYKKKKKQVRNGFLYFRQGKLSFYLKFDEEFNILKERC